MTRLSLATVVLLAFIASTSFADTWSDSTGKFTVQADFVSFADGTVKLKRANGKVIDIPLARLSAADQKRVKDLVAAKAAPAPMPAKVAPAKSKVDAAHEELLTQIETTASARQSDVVLVTRDGKKSRSTDAVVDINLSGAPVLSAQQVGFLVIDSASADGKPLKDFESRMGIADLARKFRTIDWNFGEPKTHLTVPVSFATSGKMPGKVSVAGKVKLKTGGTNSTVVIKNPASHSGLVKMPELENAGLKVTIKQGSPKRLDVIITGELDHLVGIELTDASGEKLDKPGSSRGSSRHRYDFETREPIPDDAQIQLNLRMNTIELAVPFQFDDLPMMKSTPDLPEIIDFLTKTQDLKDVTLTPVKGQEGQYRGEAIYGGYKHPLSITVEGTKIKWTAAQIIDDKRKVGPWQNWGRWRAETHQ